MSEHTPDDTTVRERIDAWRHERPVTGAVMLWAASAMLVLIAVQPAALQITDVSLRGPLAGTGALLTFAAGTLALARPERATTAGAVGAVVAFLTIPAVIALGSVSGMLELLFGAVLFGAAGGLACTGWRPDREPSQSPIKRHAGTMAVLFAFLVVASSGAATAGNFPRQDSYGGFIFGSDTLSADELDTRPNCRALIDDCNDITVDTRTQQSVPAVRLKLTGVSATNFLISENMQESDGSWINVKIRASEATATGDRGLDLYASEAWIDYGKADLTVFGDAVSVPIDELKNRWLCNPRADANRNDPGGFGTLDDTRLGIDATPALRDGQDIYQLTHVVGTSNTVLENFELDVNTTRDPGIEIDRDEPSFPDECA